MAQRPLTDIGLTDSTGASFAKTWTCDGNCFVHQVMVKLSTDGTVAGENIIIKRTPLANATLGITANHACDTRALDSDGEDNFSFDNVGWFSKGDILTVSFANTPGATAYITIQKDDGWDR